MSGVVEGELCQQAQAGGQDPVPAQLQGQNQRQDQHQDQVQGQAQQSFVDSLPEIAEPSLLAGRLSGSFGLRGRAILALAGLCGLGAFGIWSLVSADQEGSVKLDAVQAQSSRMRAVSPATSPDYRDRLGTYSERRGNQALAQGGTFVAPQEGVHEPEPGDPALAPQVRKPPAPEPPAKPKASPQPVRYDPQPQPQRPPVHRREALAQRRERGDSGLVSYLASLHREPGAPQTLVLHRAAPPRVAALAGAGAGNLSSLAALPELAPGSVLYAVNRVALDSDAPGPAMAEVLAGPLKGARAMGGFQRHSGYLALKFTSLALPARLGGQTLRIEAWAVDPRTERTALRSDVDNHYLERWGGLLAASFLEGFGEAVSRAGISQGVTSYGAWQRWPRYDLEEQLAIGAGKLGSKASGIFERNFSQPPTVTLDAGAELGILLLEIRQERAGAVLGAAAGSGQASGAAAGGSGGAEGASGAQAPGRPRLAEQTGLRPFGSW